MHTLLASFIDICLLVFFKLLLTYNTYTEKYTHTRAIVQFDEFIQNEHLLNQHPDQVVLDILQHNTSPFLCLLLVYFSKSVTNILILIMD